MTRKIPALGNIVRDITTGFTGIAIQYIELISGTVQLAVQPQLPEGQTTTGTPEAIPAALSIDLAQLDYVDAGIVDRVQSATAQYIVLGNKVEDLASGLSGIAVLRSTFINGCVYYNVQPAQTDMQKEEGDFPTTAFVAAQRLKVTGDGIAKKMAPTTAAEPARRPGGPTTKAMRAS